MAVQNHSSRLLGLVFFIVLVVLARGSDAQKVYRFEQAGSSTPRLSTGSMCSLVYGGWPKTVGCTFNVMFSKDYWMKFAFNLEAAQSDSSTFALKFGMESAAVPGVDLQSAVTAVEAVVDLGENHDIGKYLKDDLYVDLKDLSAAYPRTFPQLGEISSFGIDDLRNGLSLKDISDSAAVLLNLIGGDVELKFPGLTIEGGEWRFGLILEATYFNKEKVEFGELLGDISTSTAVKWAMKPFGAVVDKAITQFFPDTEPDVFIVDIVNSVEKVYPNSGFIQPAGRASRFAMFAVSPEAAEVDAQRGGNSAPRTAANAAGLTLAALVATAMAF